MRRASPRCCLGGEFPADKFECRIQLEQEKFMGKRSWMSGVEGVEVKPMSPKDRVKHGDKFDFLVRFPGLLGLRLSREELRGLMGQIGVALRPECGGKSIQEILEEELDTIVERMMNGAESEDGGDKFRAQGIAYALAVFMNPYSPDMEAVREAAMSRYEAQSAEPE